MFQITRRIDYAFRIMMELGSLYDGKPIPTHEIASCTNVPQAFMRKIVVELAKNNLLQTVKGPNGGLVLGRSLESITMLQIIEALEGPVCLNICLLRQGACEREEFCPGHDYWSDVQRVLVAKLQAGRLDTMVADYRLRQEKLKQISSPS